MIASMMHKPVGEETVRPCVSFVIEKALCYNVFTHNGDYLLFGVAFAACT
jgi:hypothetical protein